MDIRLFPFDSQDCQIKFGSWTNNGLKVDIKMISWAMDTWSTHPHQPQYIRFLPRIAGNDPELSKEWEMTGARGKRNEVKYEYPPEPYLDITYVLKLKRKSAKHIVRLLVPSALLTFLGILSLLLPASQPSSRLLILLFSFLMISLGSSEVPQPSLMATMLGSCIFTLLLLIVHTILVASLANSRSFYLACSPIWPQRWMTKEDSFKAQTQRIAWWIDFSAFWIYLLCFGGFLLRSVATV